MAKRKVSSTGYTIPEWVLIDPDAKPFTSGGLRRDYKRLFWEAQYYIHYDVSSKVLSSEFIKYCAKHFDKKDAAVLKKLPDHMFSTIGKYTYIVNKGGKLTEDDTTLVEKHYNALLEQAQVVASKDKKDQAIEDSKPKAPVISIQQRMRDQVVDLVSECEHYLDIMVDGDMEVGDKFDPYNNMLSYDTEIKPAHAKIIRDQFVPMRDEAQEVVDWNDEDIKEAYANFDTAKKRKAFLAFYEQILTACDTIINTGKANRKTRVKKAPTKDKLVAKLKYKESDPNTGMASINPISIVEAKILWVFNTKNRKLGVYVADELQGPLSVKGASITGYDPVKSVQKTIRKPEETLRGAGKLARTKMQKLYDGVKATDTKLNGRLNEHTILIKVF